MVALSINHHQLDYYQTNKNICIRAIGTCAKAIVNTYELDSDRSIELLIDM